MSAALDAPPRSRTEAALDVAVRALSAIGAPHGKGNELENAMRDAAIIALERIAELRRSAK